MAKTIVHFGSPEGTTYGETNKKILVVQETQKGHND
jgi:hypothetical protein